MPPKALHFALELTEIEAGWTDFDVTNELPGDVREEVATFIEHATARERTTLVQAEIDDGVPDKVPAEVGQESTLLADERDLKTEWAALQREQPVLVATDEAHKTEVTETTERNADAQAELENLQTEFLTLKAELGTEAALRQILTMATLPKAQQHIRAVLGTVGLLRTTLPKKASALTQLFNQANLDLSAASISASFADVLAQAETSPEFSPEDIATMRQVIERQAGYVRTGSDVQAELRQTQVNADGKTVPAHSEDRPLQFRENVAGFTEANGSQKLRATTSHGERVTLDITGWSSADVGRASELLQLWAMTENEGQTGYLTSLTKLNWSDSARIDPITLQQASQVISAVLGHGEGHDGDIFDGRDAVGLIRWQAQLANPTGNTRRGHRNAEHTRNALQGLGIQDEHGQLDLDVLRAFGDYSRDHWHTVPDYEAVRGHLAGLFPEKFGAETEAAQAG